MGKARQRFVFTDFNSLQKVKFKKLRKVCDRLYILIDKQQTQIPFSLVKQLQVFGKNASWITYENTSKENLYLQMAFLLGNIHHTTEEEVEFALLSDNKGLDNLVNMINDFGRSCLRVKTGQEDAFSETPDLLDTEPKEKKNGFKTSEAVLKAKKSAMDKLVASGNRPMDVSMLKTYILLHSESVIPNGDVDKVIHEMERSAEISVQNGDVTYNF